jgi:hypothetical protein
MRQQGIAVSDSVQVPLQLMTVREEEHDVLLATDCIISQSVGSLLKL